jgi:hypothetical protein
MDRVKVIRDDSILSDVSDLKKMVTILRMQKPRKSYTKRWNH